MRFQFEFFFTRFIFLLSPTAFEMSKFDWTLDDNRIENISRFLEQHGPHFEFDSWSFNYYMPKEGSCDVIGERNCT